MNKTTVARSLILYFSSEIFLSFGIGLATYAQPLFFKSAGLSDQTIGLLFSINSLAAGVFALLFGSVADRVGASRVFKLSTLLMAVSYLMMGITHSLGWWAWAIALQGLAAAMLMSTENVVLSSLTKGREKAAVLSKFVALYTFIIGSGVVASGYFSTAYGYQETIRLGGWIALVAPGIRVFVRAPDAKSEKLFRLPSGRIWGMSVYAILFGLGTNLLNPFATLILHGHLGLSNGATAWVSSASTFTMALGSFMVSAVLRRLRQERTLLVSFASAVGVTAAMAWMQSAPWFSGLYLTRTVVTSLPGSIVDALFLNLSKESEYAQMFGVRVFGNSLGNAAGSYGGGVLLNHQEMVGLLLLSALTFAAAYAYLRLLLKRNTGKTDLCPEEQHATGTHS